MLYPWPPSSFTSASDDLEVRQLNSMHPCGDMAGPTAAGSVSAPLVSLGRGRVSPCSRNRSEPWVPRVFPESDEIHHQSSCARRQRTSRRPLGKRDEDSIPGPAPSRPTRRRSKGVMRLGSVSRKASSPASKILRNRHGRIHDVDAVRDPRVARSRIPQVHVFPDLEVCQRPMEHPLADDRPIANRHAHGTGIEPSVGMI